MGDDNSSYKLLGSAANVSDRDLDALKHLYDGAVDLLRGLVKVSKTISSLSQYAGPAGDVISLAVGLGELLSSDPGPSQFDILYQEIKSLIEDVKQEIASAAHHSDDEWLSSIEREAVNIKAAALAYAGELATNKVIVPGTPVAVAFGDALYSSPGLVTQMCENAFWQKVFDPSQLCKVDGSGARRYEPKHESSDPNLVWDYRASLPLLIKVMEARVLCLHLSSAPWTDETFIEIDAMADYLTGIHNRIQLALVPTEVPGVAQRFGTSWKGDDWKHGILAAGAWFELDQPCGAVDMYAGRGAVKPFPLPQLDPPPASNAGLTSQPDPISTIDYQQGGAKRAPFNLLYLVLALRARKYLEDLAGLEGVRTYIAQLRDMTGGVHATVAPPLATPFGPAEIASPPDYLLQELARPIFDINAKDQQVLLPFLVQWPSNVKDLAAYFASLYGGDGTSLSSLTTGN